MNVRFNPTSIQAENNPATKETAFIWFYSKEISVRIVVDKNIKQLREAYDKAEKIIKQKNQVTKE